MTNQKMAHQSSATGMQAIPTTGIAHGIQYLDQQGLLDSSGEKPIVVCSIGDGSMTEGEVSEALQMAVLHQLPMVYYVQDNDWGISASGDEMRAMDAYEFGAGFKGLKRIRITGNRFAECHHEVGKALKWVRKHRQPMLIHVKLPLLGHHTSGVRSEWYRDDLDEHQKRDPLNLLIQEALDTHITEDEIKAIFDEEKENIARDFAAAIEAPEPVEEDLTAHITAPSDYTKEVGLRKPRNR